MGLTNAIPENEVAVTKTGRSFLPHFHYNPGYQVGGGFRFGAKRVFDLTSLYTWMSAHPKRVVEADEISPSFLPINWLTSNSLESASYQRASLEMRANCHYPEVQFGYNFIINSHLNLRPYTALASIIVAGDLKTHYQFTPPGGIKAAARRHGKSFAWSLGPKLGLDFVVLPWKDWGLFSNVNFTHQAVQLKMKTKQIDKRPDGTEFVIQKGKLDQLRSVSIVGLEIGPFWDHWFSHQSARLQLRATWRSSTLPGAHLSFLNNNNVDVPIGAEFRGFNLRVLLEF